MKQLPIYAWSFSLLVGGTNGRVIEISTSSTNCNNALEEARKIQADILAAFPVRFEGQSVVLHLDAVSATGLLEKIDD